MDLTDLHGFHDYHVVGHAVDHEEGTLTISLTHPHREPVERTDLVLQGCVAYHLVHGTFGGQNIIGSIAEIDPNEIQARYAGEFAKDLPYGWPGKWAASEDEARNFFAKERIRGFWIVPSIGLSGWVLAKAYEIRPATGG